MNNTEGINDNVWEYAKKMTEAGMGGGVSKTIPVIKTRAVKPEEKTPLWEHFLMALAMGPKTYTQALLRSGMAEKALKRKYQLEAEFDPKETPEEKEARGMKTWKEKKDITSTDPLYQARLKEAQANAGLADLYNEYNRLSADPVANKKELNKIAERIEMLGGLLQK